MNPKKAAMNVPSKEEALEESNVVPETREKKEFVRDFKNKKATEIIALLYQEKLASQEENFNDIKCSCGYIGTPYHDGRCPECGNIGGTEPVQEAPVSIHEPYSRTRAATLLQNDIAKCMAERWNFMK